MKLLGEVTRNLLFTGKGGVGKTSIACAPPSRWPMRANAFSW